MKIDKNLIDKMNKMGYDSSFSFILFLLYKLNDNPKYATLSELPFIVSGENLLRFLDYYGGKTISIPKKQEFLDIISALSVLRSSNFEQLTYDECEQFISDKERSKEIFECYNDICEILNKYDFE